MSAEQNVMDAPSGQESRSSHPEPEFENTGSGAGGGFEMDENGQRVAQGMGQSKSSRRRRRKRKMKAEGTAGGVELAAESEAGEAPESEDGGTRESAGRKESGSGRAPQQPGPSQGAQFSNGTAPGGTKRWKKKFRERDRPRGGDNPGNGNNGNSGGFREGSHGNGGQFRGADTHQPGNNAFKRKGGSFSSGKPGRRDGGGRNGFVGPMDHSYRAPGGFADLGTTTVDVFGGGSRRGGYSGDPQPIDYSQGRNVPIAPDAPTHIYFFIEDLFITAKIQETARKLGVKVAFIKNEKEQVAQLLAGEENERPSLIVFDLNNAAAKPMTLMPKIKSKLKKSVSIIGFLSHLQGDLKAKAMESGCDTVMPRAAFSQNLPNLLRRYGIEETEEVANFNQ